MSVANPSLVNPTEAPSLTLSQHINASPQKVFEAWLDPQILCKWIGPRKFVTSCEVVQLDPHVGGRYTLRTTKTPMPGQPECSGGVSGIYKAIERFTKLAFTWKRDGEAEDTLVTVKFEPAGAGTKVTLTHSGFPSEMVCDQHKVGWGGSLPQLADLLEMRLTLKQQINASPQKVFDALVDIQQVAKWMGPRTMVENCQVQQYDARVGGKYRLKMVRRADSPRGPGEQSVGGTFEVIDRPNRLVYSWQWDEETQPSRVTFTLMPHAGGTELTLTHEGFACIDSQQGHYRGWTQTLLQLGEFCGA